MDVTKMTLTEFLYERRDDFYDYLKLFDAVEISNRRRNRPSFYIISSDKMKEFEQLENVKKQLLGGNDNE